MRLKFVNGKQRELIRDFKSNGGLSWKQLADLLKIKEGRLKAYVEETSLISENIYEKIDRKMNMKNLLLKKEKRIGEE